jgi:hypothetical protein
VYSSSHHDRHHARGFSRASETVLAGARRRSSGATSTVSTTSTPKTRRGVVCGCGRRQRSTAARPRRVHRGRWWSSSPVSTPGRVRWMIFRCHAGRACAVIHVEPRLSAPLGQPQITSLYAYIGASSTHHHGVGVLGRTAAHLSRQGGMCRSEATRTPWIPLIGTSAIAEKSASYSTLPTCHGIAHPGLETSTEDHASIRISRRYRRGV